MVPRSVRRLYWCFSATLYGAQLSDMPGSLSALVRLTKDATQHETHTADFDTRVPPCFSQNLGFSLLLSDSADGDSAEDNRGSRKGTEYLGSAKGRLTTWGVRRWRKLGPAKTMRQNKQGHKGFMINHNPDNFLHTYCRRRRRKFLLTMRQTTEKKTSSFSEMHQRCVVLFVPLRVLSAEQQTRKK